MYGEEYPSAVVMEGTRMVLAIETRFTRTYRVPEAERKTAKCGGYIVSRFMDGSASITAEQLRHEWPTWKEWERVDFCQSSSWLYKQIDYPEMLRFIMQHGAPSMNLIQLGASPADFEDQVRMLSQHACSRNRDSSRKAFSSHYSWLRESQA